MTINPESLNGISERSTLRSHVCSFDVEAKLLRFKSDAERLRRRHYPEPDISYTALHGITDEKMLLELMQNLQLRFDGKIRAAGFEKDFWTPNKLQLLSKIINLVVLSKKGLCSAADSLREGVQDFGKFRWCDVGVEPAFHALQVDNGLDVCRDKGMDGYYRYLGMLGRNLYTLGNIFVGKERERRRKELLQLTG